MPFTNTSSSEILSNVAFRAPQLVRCPCGVTGGADRLYHGAQYDPEFWPSWWCSIHRHNPSHEFAQNPWIGSTGHNPVIRLIRCFRCPWPRWARRLWQCPSPESKLPSSN